jgi:hypothetical protein
MRMINLSPDAVWILRAVFGLGLWTYVMSSWMGLARLPAMKSAGLKLQDAAHVSDLTGKLPSRVRRISDNYNHLLEAPTVFYAAALGIVVAGRADAVTAGLAWGFVALRVGHSLVQATFNRVKVRVVLYVGSWTVLAVLLAWPLVTLG